MSEIDGKFRMLYQEKYVPLKAQLKRHLELQDSLTQQHSDAFQASFLPPSDPPPPPPPPYNLFCFVDGSKVMTNGTAPMAT